MSHMLLQGRWLVGLSGLLLLSACVAMPAPPPPPHKVALPDLSNASRTTLLQALHNCGMANSLACARIHLALANSYLRSGPLNKTALGNADRELELAAQNQDMAIQTLPLRRTVQALLENQMLLHQCQSRMQHSQLQTRAAQQAASAAESRLQQLETLLQQHAEKSLKTPDQRKP
ncbi:hypothetical protein HHS34_012015 [Acidithiobacillus montserratensis]|uniref:Uncharacterized protein n=1 Tax=Acidithiobacillus montserratensis TaxID=2729135 RepID=A0ACD5HDS3_9PROT|nr:hypothetical protein [Acidithiobacillus montserratensis]MBN2679228.1 hypothetical protein [Acidithiobacillaceae bacterium]MBU2748382.1 hypothetical protein [Acidithiobacillus montserratensis]